MKDRTRVNEHIRALEVRVIGPEGENFGVLSTKIAIDKAREVGLDLIEISPNANPPVAKIADFGKYKYEESKKKKEAKHRAHTTEVKQIQVKIGTGEHDLALKAAKASEWLTDGDRVKVDLFLPGRSKYMDQKFLKERLDRVLRLLTVPYKVALPPEKSQKGLSMLIERSK
ncbi:MAG: translation initiation factor IF-3 [Patescibacteria group bacterium]